MRFWTIKIIVVHSSKIILSITIKNNIKCELFIDMGFVFSKIFNTILGNKEMRILILGSFVVILKRLG